MTTEITKIKDTVKQNFTDAERAHRDVRDKNFTWDEREQMMFGRYKNANEGTRAEYSTGELMNLVYDASCRVMAQLPTGRFTNLDDEDILNTIAMNLVYEHYVIPNANTGGSYLVKSRQVNMYARIYGTMPVFTDWVVRNHYEGPDPIIIHPRRFYPQPGKYAIEDMDWCFIDVPVTKKWLQERAKQPDSPWMNVELVQETGGADSDNASYNEKNSNTGSKKEVLLRHYLTASGDWMVYDTTSDVIVLNEKGYFPDIPIVDKHTIPLLDRYWGLSDFERGERPQKTIDALIRYYLDSVALSIDPPLVMDPESVVLSSIVRKPRAKWFTKGQASITPVNVSPQGIGTFQTTYNLLKANLLSLGATTDTMVTRETDPAFGKTPQALQQQAQREGARDSWDRFMQEEFLRRLADKMAALIVHKGLDVKKIPNISNALERVKSAYPDKDLTVFEKGKIDEKYLKGTFRYEIDAGSTMKRDDAGRKMFGILNTMAKNQQVMQSLEQGGKTINWGEAIKRIAIDEGIQDWDKIVVDRTSPESVDGVGDAEGTTQGTPQTPEALIAAAQQQDPAAFAPQETTMPSQEQLTQ